MAWFAATIFLSAFLLFQVQPLIAKFILPWFGGSAAVWSAALLFFQLVLLGGYFYAHCLIRYFKPKAQFAIHATLLAASLLALPIVPASRWKPISAGDPTIEILVLLAATIGLPYLLLAATSPLLQAWFVRTHKGAIPYRWFALSNFGSMLALVSYPFLVEPRMLLGAQAITWSSGYGLFALLCVIVAASQWRKPPGLRSQWRGTEPSTAQAWRLTPLLWIGLAASASTLLLAVTSHLSQNIAPIPLLWVAPLSLYLLSFILCFESEHFYIRGLFLPLFAAALATLAWGDYAYENNIDIKTLIPALCAALFVCCMVCHGELARRKPDPQALTLFYLMISIGGAIGGLFVALIAPRIFPSFLEYPIALAATAISVTAALWSKLNHFARAAAAVAVAAFAAYLAYAQLKNERAYALTVRNFYGVLRVRDDPQWRSLIHGTINHGTQLKGPGSDRIPTSYFGRDSGVALALRALGDRGPLRIGVLGLGAGVTAALARAGDTLHYYEINPLIVEIAKTQFGFFHACPAEKALFMGDGRLTLERMPAENLDFLAMDAFSSDSVPVHLLTREAYAIYRRHLKTDGVLAINVSNRYLDLEPVVARAASELGWTARVVYDDAEEEDFYSSSTWVLLSPDARIFDHRVLRGYGALQTRDGILGWTDDYSNLLQILK